MKKVRWSLKMGLCLVVMAFSYLYTNAQQNGFNYKAIIKDDLGNVIANQFVTIQFTILEGAVQVYQETHTPSTNANGLVNLTIGTGTTSDSFESIDWSIQNHALNTQVDLGSGLVDLGTVPFQSVPYASFAKKSTGLTPLDEGNGQGWRLYGKNQLQYSNIGNNAIDLSYSNLVLLEGDERGAAGDYSIAMGEGTTALGIASTATGNNTQALGNYSMAMGRITKAESFASVVLGRYNIGGGTTNSWQPLDPLFEIGNGNSNSNRSNALTVFKNGTITAPSFDLAEITNDKALITKEFFDTNSFSGEYSDLTNTPNIINPTGLEAIIENDNQGWRLFGATPEDRLSIGIQALDLSRRNNVANGLTGASGNFAIALGVNSVASGYAAFAGGQSSLASGGNSIAFGQGAQATGSHSIAINGIASGTNSTAIFGYANGDYSTAMGFETISESSLSTAIGSYNIGIGTNSAANQISTDPILEVGNGTNQNNRSNALTVLKNGKVGIIEHQPNSYLHIKADSGASVDHIELTETNAADGARLSFNNSEETTNKWTLYGRARDNSIDSRFNLFHSITGNILVATGDGKVGVNRTPATNALEVSGNASKTTAGSWLANSDKRLKSNIKTISPKDALQLITKLRGVTYNWNDTKTGMERPKALQYGFIAQEIKDVFPEKVSQDNLGYYQTAYGDYDALFVQAFKALNNKIDNLEKENTHLKAKLNRLEELEARLSALESITLKPTNLVVKK